MRHLKKKLIALGTGLAMLAATATSLPAFAATWYPWGPNYWTPDSGSFFANPRMVDVWNLEWDRWDLVEIAEEQMEKRGGDLTIEFEFRPDIDMHGLWNDVKSFTSNLPSSFYEYQLFDHDDISIGSRKVASCTSSTTYYGSLSTKEGNAASLAKTYVFESEYGIWLSGISDLINDSQPLAYEQYNDGQACLLGGSYAW